jgi:hypothetical protein
MTGANLDLVRTSDPPHLATCERSLRGEGLYVNGADREIARERDRVSKHVCEGSRVSRADLRLSPRR